MKKITLLFLLMFSLAGYSQNKIDFNRRTKELDDAANWSVKKGWTKTAEDAYVEDKFKGLDKVIEFTDEQKGEFDKLFHQQYAEFKASFDNYTKTNTTQSKIDLIKVLLKQEEGFRALLNDKQMIYYKSYNPEAMAMGNLPFLKNFMTEMTYMSYKKELL
jgi:hypothetical protein